ncbi:MAG: RNA polymerase sigma factor (sigma-70 family) [Parvicella sp.]|jgi:RNA polymerase sigma factor (sigma-70 family)
MVYNVALSYVQNVENAQEITQDVFVKVYQKLDSFNEQSSVKTWIYRITINQSLDFIKMSSRKKRFGFMTGLLDRQNREHSVFTHFDHPGVQLEQKEAVQKIYDGINQLPAKQKTVLLLRIQEELSIKEIAEVLEATPKAVESLVSRARKKLELIMRNEG